MLVLSRPEYSELALECRQKVKSRNYFAQVSNSTKKFLSVNVTVFRQTTEQDMLLFGIVRQLEREFFAHRICQKLCYAWYKIGLENQSN